MNGTTTPDEQCCMRQTAFANLEILNLGSLRSVRLVGYAAVLILRCSRRPRYPSRLGGIHPGSENSVSAFSLMCLDSLAGSHVR